MERIGAIITAAGVGDRDGAKKALDDIDGITMAERIVQNFYRAGIKEIVIITGHQTEELKKLLKWKGIVFLQNERYDSSEMLDSVKIGLKYLEKRCDKILVTPVDVPLFSMETVIRLTDCEGQIIVPSYQMQCGHPILIDKMAFRAICQYEGKEGLKGWIRSVADKIYYMNVEDEGIAVDSVDEKNLQRLAKKKQNQMQHINVDAQLVNRKPFFGSGMVVLLKQIQSLGSVREASDKCGISYSKAWSMLRIAESEYGKELVARQNGGKYGGEAKVTKEGLELIQKYELLEKEIQEFANDRFQHIFGKKSEK